MKTSVDIPDDLWKSSKDLSCGREQRPSGCDYRSLQEHLGKKAKARDKGGKEK